MTYFINKYDGTQVASVAEGAMDTTSTSLKLVGRNFVNYGEVIAENLVHLLENFAGETPPSGTILDGQLWWNTDELKLYVYSGAQWVLTGGINYGNTDGDPNSNNDGPSELPPTGSAEGELFWDQDTQQLWAWTTEDTDRWVLVGPPAPDTSDTKVEYKDISGNGCLVMRSDGTDVAIWSATQFNPGSPWNTQFPTIYAGLTFRKDDTNTIYSGAHLPTITDNFDLGSASKRWDQLYVRQVIFDELVETGEAEPVSFANYMRTDQTNIPLVNNTYNLGSSGNKYAAVYATNLYGTSQSATYADLAERYESDMPLEAGDLVKLGGEKEITKTSNDGDIDVFGVISVSPGFAMNSDAGDNTSHPYVAFSGRLPCKVIGTVNKGARLVSSEIPGVARAYIHGDDILSIFGRSLVKKTNHDVELIEVVVGAR